MGKAYANRKPIEERPDSDFYGTPRSVIWEMIDKGIFDDSKNVLDPCCGDKVFEQELSKKGFHVTSKDIQTGNDFLEEKYEFGEFDTVASNPPFSLFDSFVLKAKEVAPKVVFIGKTNFLGAHSRQLNGVWKNLSDVYVLDRQIDYQFPVQDNGDVGVGCLVTCVYVWNKDYTASPRLHFIDMNKYCKLGGYENWLKKNDPDKYQQLLDKKELKK